MIGALLGGANAAAKGVGIGTRILQGAGIASGTYGLYELGQVPHNIRKGILSTDYDPATNKYDTNIFQDVLMKLPGGGGGKDTLVDEKNKQIRNVAFRNGVIEKAMKKDPSLVYKPGMTLKDFQVANSEELDIIALKDRAKATKFINKEATAEERRRYEDREYRLDQDRLDLLTQQSNNLEYQRSRDRRADMQYNENLARLDRKDRRTAISSATAGLAALAAAFAI